MNNFKKIVSLFLFGMMASPMYSMDFNIVDASTNKNKPTSFIAIMQQRNKIKAQQTAEQQMFYQEEQCSISAENYRKEQAQIMIEKNISVEVIEQGSPNVVTYSPRTPITPGKSILKTSQYYTPKKK